MKLRRKFRNGINLIALLVVVAPVLFLAECLEERMKIPPHISSPITLGLGLLWCIFLGALLISGIIQIAGSLGWL